VLVVGERINTSRKRIHRAVRQRDAAFIQKEAKRQVAAGACYVDVNAGTSVADEVEDLKWLVDTVQAAVAEPLCIDSANPAALEAALKRNKNGQPLVNSISAEQERLQGVLPLVRQYEARVVGLAMDDGGMPSGVDDRMTIVHKLSDAVDTAGVSLDHLYVDPLIRPISTNQDQALAAVEVVRRIRHEGKAHTICGLSNISFGLPARKVVNRVFLGMMLEAGLEAAIIDPTDPQVMATVYAGQALVNEDQFCMDYIMAAREGRLAAD